MADRHTFFKALEYLAERGDIGTLAYILGDAELIRIDAVTGERPTSPGSRVGRSPVPGQDTNGGFYAIE